MHTTYSDGESTVEDYVETARSMGLSEIAITDHCWRSSDWIADYVHEIQTIDDRYDDFSVLAGLEAKVIDDDGSVDVSPAAIDQVDFVMGVVHRYQPEASEPHGDLCGVDPAKAAERERDLTLALLSNPVVTVVGHPSRTYYKFHYSNETPHFPRSHYIDIIDAANDVSKPLEYNARLPHDPRDTLLQLYVEHDHGFTIGSDSHCADSLSTLDRETVAERLTGGTRD